MVRTNKDDIDYVEQKTQSVEECEILLGVPKKTTSEHFLLEAAELLGYEHWNLYFRIYNNSMHTALANWFNIYLRQLYKRILQNK